MAEIYDPQDIRTNTIAELMRREALMLGGITEDSGGVYALFYTGPFDLYAGVRSADALTPIYAGATTDLTTRLRIHTLSIHHAANLEVAHFLCRYLPLPDGWHHTIEQELILKFQPPWNQPHLRGFGNNGSHRVGKKASAWDIVHPGRPRAVGLTGKPAALLHHLVRDAEDGGIFDLFGS